LPGLKHGAGGRDRLAAPLEFKSVEGGAGRHAIAGINLSAKDIARPEIDVAGGAREPEAEHSLHEAATRQPPVLNLAEHLSLRIRVHEILPRREMFHRRIGRRKVGAL
jgi:hypothetical protein